MGICGFTSQVLLSRDASGLTLRIQISTILSLETLVPVVSKSNMQSGLWSFKFIFFYLLGQVVTCQLKWFIWIIVFEKLMKPKYNIKSQAEFPQF
jgi:hypothetical protein